MADANGISDTVLQEIGYLDINYVAETEDEQIEEDAGDIPPSLLSYFETSQSRAAVCQSLLLETPAESEKHASFGLEIYQDETKLKQSGEGELEKHQCMEMNNGNQEGQLETDFQKELREIMETEELHQKELELREELVQKKLEQEFLLQQEMINSLQRRVQEVRRKTEEEQKCIKDEEDRRRREEGKRELREERERLEEEMRRMDEERIDKMKQMEEEIKRREQEERGKRRKEEEMIKMIQKEEERRIEGITFKMYEENRKDERRIEDMKMKRTDEEKKVKREEERVEMLKPKEIDEKVEKWGEKEPKRMLEENKTMEDQKRIEKVKLQQKEEIQRKEEIIEIMKDGVRAEEKKDKIKTRRDERRIEEITLEIEEMEKETKRREDEERKEIKPESMEEEMNKGVQNMSREKVERKEREEKRRFSLGNMERVEERSEIHLVKGLEDEMRSMQENNQNKEEERVKEVDDIQEENTRMRTETKAEERKKNWTERRVRIQENMEIAEEVGMKNQEAVYEEGSKEYMEKNEDQRKQQRRKQRKKEGIEKEEEHPGGVQENMRKKGHYGKSWKEFRLKGYAESNKPQDGENQRVEAKRRLEEEEDVKQVVEDGENDRRGVEQENILKVPHEELVHTQAVTWTSSLPASPIRDTSPGFSEAVAPQQAGGVILQAPPSAASSTVSGELLQWLPDHTELKRLSWMKDCTSWTKLSLHNKRKCGTSVRRHRGPQKASGATSLPPLSPQSLLLPAGVKSLKEVTTVTLEDLPGCTLSTVALCSHLQLLSLRRCGLTSLDGINQLQKLCYIDVQENHISFVDCENMKGLRVLQLSHNKLTSIHGLAGAENLEVLHLSHNSITRISGLESMKRLQKLSLDHNELISTSGLSHMCTLLHLSCSHNHLTSVDGLENNALLHTLDLRANSLAEPPRLSNQVLLRVLYLDDNSISSLQGLGACWLPLMQHLSVAQNRITELPSMSDYVSLEKLDLQLNCISELQNVCESLEGCLSLQEVHLTGNPLQQERSWRSTLLTAVPGLRAVDQQVTASSSAVEQTRVAPGSFLSVCQAHLQETSELHQRHSKELREAASLLDVAKISCRHLHESLQLAMEQRCTHEYDDADAEKHWGRNRVNYRTFDQNSAESCIQDRFQPAVSMVNPGGVQAAGKRENMIPSNAEIPPVTNLQAQTLQSAAALVIQQQWSKYRLKCGARNRCTRRDQDAKSRSAAQDQAATVIQAFWKGFSLRRRLKAALAPVTGSDVLKDDFFEDDTLEELDPFFFKQWKVLSGGDILPVTQQQKSCPGSSQLSRAAQRWRSREGWVDAEQVEVDELRVSPTSFNRSESPTSDVKSLSKTSEIMKEWGFTHSETALLMLKRAQKMKSKKVQQKKGPCVQVDFANGNLQITGNRTTRHDRTYGRVGKAEQGLQQWERKERAQHQLHAQTLHWEPVSQCFLPDIHGESLNGGRAQLLADQGHTQHPHQTCGTSCNSGSAVRPQKQNSRPPRNSLCRARQPFPSAKGTAALSQKERMSFRDNPVRLSSGWGGGRKKTV